MPLVCCFLSFFLVFMNNIGRSEENQGKVVELRSGTLERFSSKGWEALKKGSVVSFGDRIRTRKSSLAILELPNIGRFVIGPESEIRLGKEIKNFNSEMARGEVWMKSSLAKGSKASITTSLATAGIRGTNFSVLFYGDKDLCVCTCVGDVSVTLTNGKTIQVPGASIYVMHKDTPPPEKPESSVPLLEEKGKGFDFCFNCHIEEGKGKLKQNWE